MVQLNKEGLSKKKKKKLNKEGTMVNGWVHLEYG